MAKPTAGQQLYGCAYPHSPHMVASLPPSCYMPWTSRQCPISKRGTTTRPTQEHHRIGLLFLTTTTKRRLALCSTDSYIGTNTRSGKDLNVTAEYPVVSHQVVQSPLLIASILSQDQAMKI
eukprot:scaffold105618_cov57-Attheya_sp.AAC.1